MTKEEAENLSIALLQIVSRLDQSAAFVQDKDNEASWENYRQAVGRVMTAVYFDLAEPLWARFPELRPKQLGGPYEVDLGIYEPRFYDPGCGA